MRFRKPSPCPVGHGGVLRFHHRLCEPFPISGRHPHMPLLSFHTHHATMNVADREESSRSTGCVGQADETSGSGTARISPDVILASDAFQSPSQGLEIHFSPRSRSPLYDLGFAACCLEGLQAAGEPAESRTRLESFCRRFPPRVDRTHDDMTDWTTHCRYPSFNLICGKSLREGDNDFK